MTKNTVRSGKKSRPKTAVKGKRFRCAKCHTRSPKAVTTPAPWYCPRCLNQQVSEPEQHSLMSDNSTPTPP